MDREMTDITLSAKGISITLRDGAYTVQETDQEPKKGKYIYNDMTGEFLLDGGGKVRRYDTTGKYWYIKEDIRLELREGAEEKRELTILEGVGEILAGGVYAMKLSFFLTLYADGKFKFSNQATPSTLEGNWKKEGETVIGEGTGIRISPAPGTEDGMRLRIQADFNGYPIDIVMNGSALKGV